jgi:hypothetical protein
MKRHVLQFPTLNCLAGVIGALALGATLWAQEPFGELGAPAAEEQLPPADAVQPPGDAAAKQPAAPADPAKPAEPPPDPARYSLPIRAVLESDPQTPEQLVRSASVLIDLGEPALGRSYVLKLQQLSLDEAALGDLVRRLGSGPFLKLAGEKALEPAGREFGDRAIAAARLLPPVKPRAIRSVSHSLSSSWPTQTRKCSAARSAGCSRRTSLPCRLC